MLLFVSSSSRRDALGKEEEQKNKFAESYLAPVAFVFNARLDSLSLFKMSLFKVFEPRMEPDSLAEEEEKEENAFGANLSILTLLTASHRLELVFEEVAREDAETRTPHGCAIDCIICVNY